MVARLTLRQGGEAVLLLLQRARWDASGRLVARDFTTRETVDLDINEGEDTLEINISFPFCHVGKGRDVSL